MAAASRHWRRGPQATARPFLPLGGCCCGRGCCRSAGRLLTCVPKKGWLSPRSHSRRCHRPAACTGGYHATPNCRLPVLCRAVRCIDGLLRACRSLDGCLLVLPVHPNWESYSTVPTDWKSDSKVPAGHGGGSQHANCHPPGDRPARGRGGARSRGADEYDEGSVADLTNEELPDARFVTTRAFVRAVGGALTRRRVLRINVLAWSLGACFATMLREEFPGIELAHVVFVDPAAALPLANSAWGWASHANNKPDIWACPGRHGSGGWLAEAGRGLWRSLGNPLALGKLARRHSGRTLRRSS